MLLSIVAKIYVPKWEFNRVLYEKVRSSCRLSILRVERHNHCKVQQLGMLAGFDNAPKPFGFPPFKVVNVRWKVSPSAAPLDFSCERKAVISSRLSKEVSLVEALGKLVTRSAKTANGFPGFSDPDIDVRGRTCEGGWPQAIKYPQPL